MASDLRIAVLPASHAYRIATASNSRAADG
jgi:hypothetical protein